MDIYEIINDTNAAYCRANNLPNWKDLVAQADIVFLKFVALVQDRAAELDTYPDDIECVKRISDELYEMTTQLLEGQ